MKVKLKIHYKATYGQQIAILKTNLKQPHQSKEIIVLDYNIGDFWTTTITKATNFQYSYILINDIKTIIKQEWGEPRIVSFINKSAKDTELIDFWRSNHQDAYTLFTSAFTNVIFQSTARKPSKNQHKGNVTFKIDSPRIVGRYQLAIVGSHASLSNWRKDNPILLGNKDFPTWVSPKIHINTPSHIEYKYGLYDSQKNQLVGLEQGPNRVVTLEGESNIDTIVTDEIFRHIHGLWRGTGVATPVFSLRTRASFGIGEFSDLTLLADWAENNKIKMIQILPTNDTYATGTWTDSYPYAAISVFAQHPMYLSISRLPSFDKVINRDLYNKQKDELNSLIEVDYELVLNRKLKFIKKIFDFQYDSLLNDKEYLAFFESQKHWIKPYAVFCYLRDKNKTVNFNQWGKYSQYKEDFFDYLAASKQSIKKILHFWIYIQYHLDAQLIKASKYAKKKSIAIKGDIPIGIYRFSVDAWVAPELYDMNTQSGAPPDAFSDIGQNWGFPTYQWDIMKNNNFSWWKGRFTHLSRYFDSFRIDHILGFFRIWSIPLEYIEGNMGVFNPALPIHISEMREKGIPFNYQRYCTPFITINILNQLFADDGQTILEEYFENEDQNQILKFKDSYNSQVKLKAEFEKNPKKHKKEWFQSLIRLHGEVLFFEMKDSNRQYFHPRIDLIKTRSFKQLNSNIKAKLEALYNDYFYLRQEDFWRASAMSKLPDIKRATNMLICGEDLGMLPASVAGVMDELKILTLEIQRSSKNPQTEFVQENEIPYLSVVSSSTHDMSPIRMWWEEMNKSQQAKFYYNELNGKDLVPSKMTEKLASLIVQQHLNWNCMWAIFPLQDILAIDASIRRSDPSEERINIPANPNHYWRFRFHLNIEDLINHKNFNNKIKTMIEISGRA